MGAPPIERAAAGDAAAVLALLTENRLPVAGLLEHLPTTIVARQDGKVVGCAALEVYADGALLRSVAVAPALQHHGIGQSLTAAALQLANDLKLPAVYLLTTTADTQKNACCDRAGVTKTTIIPAPKTTAFTIA